MAYAYSWSDEDCTVTVDETIILHPTLSNVVGWEVFEDDVSIGYIVSDGATGGIYEYTPTTLGTHSLTYGNVDDCQPLNVTVVPPKISLRADVKDIIQSKISYAQVDSTSTSTSYTATVPNIYNLTDGTTVMLKNGIVTSEEGFTLNVNNLGAKPVYSNLANATRDTTIFNVNYTMLFVYDSSRVEGGCWICYRGYDSNTNTIGYQLRTNSTKYIATDKGYKYRLWLQTSDDGEFMPVNLSTSTNATSNRSSNMNSREFIIGGDIRYNSTNGTVNANAEMSATTLWQQYTLSLGYSFNNTGSALSLTASKPLYMVAVPTGGGNARLTSPYYTQSLPSLDDGKIYILLGYMYSATSMELVLEHPVFEYKDGGVRLYRDYYTESEVDNLLNDKASISDLSTVATSGSYNDLSNKPTIPTVPTNISSFANDSGYITSSSVPNPSSTTPSADTTSGSVGTGTTWARSNHTHPKSSLYAESNHIHTVSNITDFPSIPSKTSDLTNDGDDGSNVFVKNNDSRLSDSRTPTSHTHGNISNDGKINNLSNSINQNDYPVICKNDTGAIIKGSALFSTKIINQNELSNINVPNKSLQSEINDAINTSIGTINTSLNNKANSNHTHSEYVNPTIVDNLTSTSSTSVLSAKQGKVLGDLIGDAILFINGTGGS